MSTDDVAEEEIQEEIDLRIRELNETDDDHVAGEAARILFELAHFSNPFSEMNKRRIAGSHGVPALCKHLRSESYEVRYQTCSALGELAFRNEDNCVLVVNSPGALTALADMLSSTAGNNQEDAALVINNCASFCEDTAEKIVSCPGMLTSLKQLATGRHVGAKNVSIGALNCLSRSQAVHGHLCSARVVDEALVPVLDERGRGEKHEVRKARAMMAVVNLTGALPAGSTLEQRQQLQQQAAAQPHRGDAGGGHARSRQAERGGGCGEAELGSIVRVLGFALDGTKWVGVSFTPYSVLYPLNRLARGGLHRAGLVESGMLGLLLRLLAEWGAEGRRAHATLRMALEIIERLAAPAEESKGEAEEVRERDARAQRRVEEWLRGRAVLQALRRVASRGRGEEEGAKEAARRLVEQAEEGPLAFWMGQHSRLGEKSWVLQLDEYVAGMVVEMAFLHDADREALAS